MTDLRKKLVGSFQNVFPSLSEDRILSASPKTVQEWDSIASISLVNVIEEEFSTEIDFDRIADLDSFGAVEKYLQEKAAG